MEAEFVAAGYNMLSTHILQRDQSKIIELLAKSPSCMTKVTESGQTPLHLTSDWPVGLEIVLSFGGNALVNIPDSHGYLPINYACIFECVDAVKLLLKAGSAQSSPNGMAFGHEDTLYHCLSTTNRELQTVLLDGLRCQRQGLRNLACLYLPEDLRSELIGTDDRIPDAMAPKIQEALIALGVEIPPNLAVFQKSATVYHTWSVRLDINSAESLYTAGFRDTDVFDQSGKTPMMIYSAFIIDLSSRMMNWFWEHGANVKVTWHSVKAGLGPNPCSTPEHCIGMYLGKTLRSMDILGDWDFAKASQFGIPGFLPSILDSDGSDGCNCHCSSKGCLPVSMLLKQVAWQNPVTFRITHFIEDLCISDESTNGKLRQAADIVRFLTFEKMELTHTCCRLHHFGVPRFSHRLDAEEIEAIQDEESLLIDQLEQLVSEFVPMYEQLDQSLSKFLEGYWDSKMDEVLNGDNPTDARYCKELEQLGVTIMPRVVVQ